jgi:phosphinothricin acetyltransferase
VNIRKADEQDLSDILRIYNEGIADRKATLEEDQKTLDYMQNWFTVHQGRYTVLVAEEEKIVGWASLNPYSQRCAYKGVAELSIYIERAHRGKGIGIKLLQQLEKVALENDFYKIVLFTFPFNESGQGLYKKMKFRQVGIFKKQGILDGKFIDIMAMEKLL